MSKTTFAGPLAQPSEAPMNFTMSTRGAEAAMAKAAAAEEDRTRQPACIEDHAPNQSAGSDVSDKMQAAHDLKAELEAYEQESEPADPTAQVEAE